MDDYRRENEKFKKIIEDYDVIGTNLLAQMHADLERYYYILKDCPGAFNQISNLVENNYEEHRNNIMSEIYKMEAKIEENKQEMRKER